MVSSGTSDVDGEAKGMMRYLLGGTMFLVGATAALQPPINAALAKRTGSLEAAAVSFVVGTVALVIISLLMPGGSYAAVRGAPTWELTGGLIGALFVASTIFLIPRLGATGIIAGIIAGLLAGAVLVDQFGLFGIPQASVSWQRALGLLLLIIGGLLAVRR